MRPFDDPPPRWKPNFSWITEALAVGGSFPSERAELLAQEHRVNAVVDLRDEARDDENVLSLHGIRLLHLPTRDMCAVDPAHLERGIEFASQCLDAGQRVLIHCEYGIGRSATLALCLLVYRGWAPLDALQHMKDRRAAVSPTAAQFECWRAWLERHRACGVDCRWSLPTLQEFGCIAYRDMTRSS